MLIRFIYFAILLLVPERPCAIVADSLVILQRSQEQVAPENDEEQVLNQIGEQCWDKCGKGGSCDWCGTSTACCRKGWDDDPPESKLVARFQTETHECVDLTAKMIQRDDCWLPCGSKAGFCDKCGHVQGQLDYACCRRDWDADPAVCKLAAGFFTDRHECVELHEKTLVEKIQASHGALFLMFVFLFTGMILTQSFGECRMMDKLGIRDEVLGGEFNNEWYHRRFEDVVAPPDGSNRPDLEAMCEGKCLDGACAASETQAEWAFAARYSDEDILDAGRRESFLKEYVSWEGKFVQGPGVNATGLTNDGINPDDSERNWSAASKEALHLCCLARRLSLPSPLYEHLMPAEVALEALEKKVTAFETFRAKHPRFRGFLPWFLSSSLDPTHDWTGRFPCLDNGQFAWALYETWHACKDSGHSELARRYKTLFDELCEHAVVCGYAGAGKIASHCSVPESGGTPIPTGHDPMPWDQEPFSYFVDLFGNWETAGFGAAERDKLWEDKKRHAGIVKARLWTREGAIDVLKGWHFSSHELWKYLQLPLRNIPCSRNVLHQCEKARTSWAAAHFVPGLCASCSSPTGRYVEAGIAEGISDLGRSNSELLTPYGAFPTILADEATGVAFLRTMLKGRGMQGPLGSAESIWKDGSACCHVRTWDAKITTVLAVLGGGDHLEKYLKEDGLWDRFTWITERLYGEKFGGELAGSSLGFRLPTATLP